MNEINIEDVYREAFLQGWRQMVNNVEMRDVSSVQMCWRDSKAKQEVDKEKARKS